MAKNGRGGPGGGAVRLAAALAIAACLAPAPGLAQALGGHGSPDSATPLEVADGGSGALEVVEDAAPEVAAEGPVVATAQETTGTIGTASYAYDGDAKRLSVSGGTFTKAEWDDAIGSIKNSVEHIEFADAAITGDASYMFSNMPVKTIDASGLNVADVTDMSYMFYWCTSLDSLDLSGWDTGSVTYMLSMFDDCSKLTSLAGISGWDTGSVTAMSNMFLDCTSLVSLDLSNWDTGSVMSMYRMFGGCSELTSLDLSNWDTGSVMDMSSMFLDCTSLVSLDLSNWDTGSVTNMSSMFSGCSGLTSLDLSGWDTGKVSGMQRMFLDCSSLTTIAVCGWDMENVYYEDLGFMVLDEAENMFSGCTSLVGGNGTQWSSDNPTDRTYARVDGGANDPGYFTGKPAFRGCYLVLSGTIGVTFTLEVPQHFDATGAYVAFTVGGRDAGTASLGEPGEDGRYRVSCGVTSLEMADEVVAELRWDGESIAGPVTASCSVERYANYVVEHDSDYSTEMVTLAKAINDYGYYAQLWLSEEHHFGLGAGGKYAAMKEPYKKAYNYDDVKSSAESYRIQKTLGNSDVKVSYRLHLDTATGISVRLASETGGTLTATGTMPEMGPATPTPQADGSLVLRLDGIPAHLLANRLTVDGTAGPDEFSVNVCALSYVRTVFSSEDLSKQQSKLDALAAFLEYYKASIAYKSGDATA